MIVKDAAHLPFALSESSQINPLRWNILFKEEDGSFTAQSGVFKCKDYFNDAVAWYNNVKFSQYGMDFRRMKLNDEGVYVLLTELNYRDKLLNNLQVLSDEGIKEGLSPLVFEKAEKYEILLFIPKDYFRNTYTTSFLTYCIRISHCDTAFTSFEDVVVNTAYRSVDNPLTGLYDRVMAARFKAPIDIPDWTYIGKKYVGRVTGQYSSAIHNAGCYNYFLYKEQGL